MYRVHCRSHRIVLKKSYWHSISLVLSSSDQATICRYLNSLKHQTEMDTMIEAPIQTNTDVCKITMTVNLNQSFPPKLIIGS